MKFRRRPVESFGLDITPLIDVVFLLLIFFMVSTTFQQESQIALQLPRAAEAPVEPPAERVEIVINSAGRYYVNDQELLQSDVESLQTALHRLTAGERDTPLSIRADASTPHQAVVTAMDAAARLGMRRLSIATSQAES